MALLRKCGLFLRKDGLHLLSYRLAFVMNLFGILFGVAAYYFLSRLLENAGAAALAQYGKGYFSFVLIGLATYSYMNLVLGHFADSMLQGLVSGSFQSMLLSATRPLTIIIFSNLSAFAMSLAQFVIYLFVGQYVFGFDLGNVHLLSAGLIFIASGIAFLPLGILVAGFTLAFKKGTFFLLAISALSALLGGVYYPIAVLPDGLQKIAAFLPLTLGLNAFRKAIGQGAGPLQVIPELLQLGAVTLVLTALALGLFYWAFQYSRAMGTLAKS